MSLFKVTCLRQVNGMRKLPQIDEFNFMTEPDVRKAMQSLKLKNAEGQDRIPQRLLIDGAEILNKPMSTLFNLVYNDKIIPEQWKMSLIRPVHKKGPKNDISNYRPVANILANRLTIINNQIEYE